MNDGWIKVLLVCNKKMSGSFNCRLPMSGKWQGTDKARSLNRKMKYKPSFEAGFALRIASKEEVDKKVLVEAGRKPAARWTD